MSQKDLDDQAKNIKKSLEGIVYVQIIIQIFAKNNKADIQAAFMIIQMTCFFTHYTA